MTTPLVLVAGAGPTGMTAAIELKRAGMNVRIVDKSSQMAQHSQALVVQARTLEQFQRYGIASAAVDRGHKITKAHLWSEGERILSFSLEDIPSRYPYALMLPQSETEKILNQCMESLGVTTERGTELLSLAQPEGLVSAVLRHSSGKQEQLNPEWVIGCDGAHSAVRSKLDIPFEGGGVALSFFLGDLELDGPDVPGDELSVHLHHGDVVFMARLPNKLVRLIVAIHSRQDEELHRDLTLKDFQDAIDNAGVNVRVRSSDWMTPFRVHDLQARHYRAGSVFLAGDASHIHSPVGGQGMNTGIQDVANLAWKLAAVARGASDALLNSYEEERAAVGRALLRFTERGLKLATAPNPIIEAIRDNLLPIVSKLQPVQKAMLGFVSETAIEYRSSSIVADHGGDGNLRAGDRLPDLSFETSDGPSTLLRNWTSASHLAFVLSSTTTDSGAKIAALRAALPHAEVVPVPAHALDNEGRRLLGTEEKLLIVRPDGYVGFRGPVDTPTHWQAYARQDALA
ncbi:MAG TPA: FAD-dependent monooxygenase [Terracidiphilus sp.]|jgi:2-polyprenyl-6-methoxyphenol hydroxylase-like FAD-dependent oxidoreductase